MRGRLVLTALAGLCALTTACASTAQTSSSERIGGPEGAIGGTPTDGLGVGTADGVTASDPAVVGGSTGGFAASGTGGTRAGGTATGSGGTGAITPGPAGSTGRGFTATKVYIGINTWQDVGEVSGMLGGAAINTGDQQAYARAAIGAINRSGGLGGRQIEPVFYDYKTNRGLEDPAIATQEACSLWTEDRPVFAVVYGSGVGLLLDDQIATCLSKAGIPMVFMNYFGMSSWFDKFPLVWAPMSGRNVRFFPAVVGRAKAQRYFTGWDTARGAPGAAPVKVGIQTGAGAYADEVTRVIRRAVESAGYPVVATAEIDGAEDGAGANAAVLSFRSAGVTHVVQSSQCVGPTIPFMSTADSQGYFPRYLMHTGNCPQLLTRFTPARQWRGAIGAGNQPGLDVAWAQDPGDFSPARPKCLKTMTDAGENPRLSRDAYAFMVWYCDGVGFLTTAVQGGGNVLSAAAFLRGAQEIRSLLPSATFVVSFPQRRDGAAALRDLVYRDDCDCPVYVGGNRPF